MAVLSGSAIDAYRDQGFYIARGLLDTALIDQAHAEIRAIFHDQALKLGCLPASEDNLDDLIRAVMVPGTPQRSFVYNFVRHIRSVRLLEAQSAVQATLEELGFELPICFEIPSIRFDFPDLSERRFLTHAHQDVRSIRSARCVTVWIPLRRVDAHYGSVAVYPGTHRNGLIDHGIAEKHVEVPAEYLAGERVVVEADPGDVVFMNSFVVHESQVNTSDTIKLNAQFFYNDALAVTMDDEYQQLAAIPDYKDL